MFNVRRLLSMKLSLSILLLAVPVFVVSLGVLFLQSRHLVRTEAVGRANSVLNATMQRVDKHLITVQTATNTNSWLVTKYLQPDSLLSLTRRIVQLNPHIDGCSISTEPNVFPKFGRYFSAYTVRETDTVTTVIEEEYEYFEKVWYSTPRELGEPCWVVYYDEADSLELTLDGMIASYSRPLYDADGRFTAVISTDLSLLRLSKIITAEKPYPNSYFIMIDTEGRYFIHPDSTQLFTQTIFSGADPRHQTDVIALGHEMTNGNQGSMAVVINGAPSLVCYQPVPGTPWSLAVICPDSDVLKGYYQLNYIIIPLLILGLLVILLFSRRVVAHAIAPLNRLLVQTHNIASGNYEVHIPRSQRKDAVGRLQNSFASMLQRLNFHMGSVRYTAEQAERRNEELVKATRLAEESDRQKTAFIQNVSHQIRTPLNIIMGFAQVLHDGGEQLSEDEKKNIANMMDYNGMLLNRMLLMLFDSSETGINEELKIRKDDPVSCVDVARESIGYINLHYPDFQIIIQSEVPEDFCINSNHVYLMRSLRELLYNAAKYSDGQHMILRIEKTETSVRFVFEDIGPGMPEDSVDLMFKPFTKVNDLSEGLGLGLPLAKRHAQTLGGDLTLDTSYHQGCRFILELPIQ